MREGEKAETRHPEEENNTGQKGDEGLQGPWKMVPRTHQDLPLGRAAAGVRWSEVTSREP